MVICVEGWEHDVWFVMCEETLFGVAGMGKDCGVLLKGCQPICEREYMID